MGWFRWRGIGECGLYLALSLKRKTKGAYDLSSFVLCFFLILLNLLYFVLPDLDGDAE